MDDIYSTLKYSRFKRKPNAFLIVTVVLAVAAAAAITALIVRGFSFESYAKTPGTAAIPQTEFWVVKVPDYDTKMTAYASAISNKSRGCAEYVMTNTSDSKWTVIEGVYMTSADANAELMKADANPKAASAKYVISGKEIKIDERAANIVQTVFDEIKTAFEKLMEGRKNFASGAQIREVTFTASDSYKILREKTAELQTLNKEIKHESISAVIYAANQSILGLQNIIFTSETGNGFLSALNTAIAKVIFSLDNF